MNQKPFQPYPLIWSKKNVFLKVFCSIPQLATGILLKVENKPFVIDPGDGILRDLNNEIGKEKILEIDDIFVTHGHHDHVGGLWSLMTYMHVMRRKSPLNIYFPHGTIEIHSIYRAFEEVYSRDLSFKINLFELEKEQPIKLSLLSVVPFKVSHKEIIDREKIEVPSVGFKFIINDVSICYGGDTAYTSKLAEMVKDSDLAILEAGAKSSKFSDMHMTINEAADLGGTAKEFFLVHVPQ